MNKNSDANINDILNRLRQNVENQSEHAVADDSTSASAVESPDQILDKLKEHVGGAESDSNPKDFRETDYDIRGFEIEELPTEEVAEAPKQEAEDTKKPEATDESIADSEKQKETEAPVQESKDPVALPTETEPQEAESASLAEGLEEKVSKESETVERNEAADEFQPSEEEESSAENEEEVRKRVELFVEKTVEPEEEFDYFAELERKATKIKEKSTRTDTKDQEEEAVAVASEGTTELEKPSEAVAEQSPTEAMQAPIETIADGTVTQTPPATTCESNPFFYQNEAENIGNRKATNDKKAFGNVAEKLDDTDINLLLALGQKQAIEESVGFVRVREAKNNFYDPTDDEPIGHNVFAYDGQEFRAPEQAEAIKTRYRKEKKTLYKRLVGTLLVSLLLLFTEHIPLLNLKIPYVSDFWGSGVRYYLINFALAIGCTLLSVKPLLNGARGFFTMRPTQHTPISILTLLNLLYNAALILFFRETGLPSYNFALSVFLMLSVIGDVIRLTKETLTFDVISDDKEKFSLEKADSSPEISREKKALYKRDLLVERVSFVGKYFTRTSRRPVAYTEYFVELLITLIVAIFAAILVAFIGKSMAEAINTFMLVLVVCIPMQHLLSGIYPLGRLSKILYRHNSAIIGETVDNEYVGANTVYLDDIEMFGHHGVSVSGLRVYNDVDFYDVLYHAHAVFSEVEGPLRYIFENSSHEIRKSEDVKIVNIYANGIEALVDSRDKIFIGNINFMRSNGFFPKRNEDDDKKVENGELCILYMTVNGDLCAKFYMKYTITQRFEKFVAEMNENGTKVGIRTLDPNVTERMISLLRKDKETDIAVIRPMLNDLVPLGRRSDSSIIAKNPHMISRILAQCSYLKRINFFGIWMRILSMILGLGIVSVLVLAKAFSNVPSLAIVIYQLVWLIPTLIYTKIKLK